MHAVMDKTDISGWHEPSSMCFVILSSTYNTYNFVSNSVASNSDREQFANLANH